MNDMEQIDKCQVLDARGLNCPMPLLKAKQMLNQLTAGAMLKILATDPGSVRDFSSFAELAGHDLLQSTQDNGVFTFVLRKQG